jgi:hypothetical protein
MNIHGKHSVEALLEQRQVKAQTKFTRHLCRFCENKPAATRSSVQRFVLGKMPHDLENSDDCCLPHGCAF